VKEIGERLKETRESIGISIEEAAEDLKMRPSQLEDVESGNMKAFKDIYSLKYFIRDYSKYLGLDYDEMVDEFNEYLFDYTSKLSLQDIKNAKKEESKKKEPKVMSPYTIEKKEKKLIPPIVIWLLILGVIGIAVYFVADAVIDSNNNSTTQNSVLE
jgi:cytoskeletal protein RodZ